jgi:hypothetical protein
MGDGECNVLGHPDDADFFDAALEVLGDAVFDVRGEDLGAADFQDVLFWGEND